MTCPCRPLCFAPKDGCASPNAVAELTTVPRAVAMARFVRQLPLFAGLEPKLMQSLMADAAVIREPAGTLLFTDGTEADCFYVVLSGQVKLFALLPDGRDSIIEVVRAVSSFGEAAMMGGGSFPVSAEVLEDCTLLRVGRRAFVATLQSNHAVAYRMLASLCVWQQRLTGEVQLLRDKPAWLRVADHLLELAANQIGTVEIDLPFSKEVLASRVGICRESLSRVLRHLRSHGVTSSGSTFTIVDLEHLRLVCANVRVSLN